VLSESSRAGGPLGVAWCLRPLWRRRQHRVGGVPCAPVRRAFTLSAELSVPTFVRGHPAAFASFFYRAGAVFCARCVAALAAAVALCVCPLRFRCAAVGSFWPALCVAVVLPTSATCGCVLQASALRCPCCALAVPRRLLSPSFGSSHVPAAMVLEPLFCCRLAWQPRRF